MKPYLSPLLVICLGVAGLGVFVPAVSAETPSAEHSASEPTAIEHYTVVSGDTLSLISQRLLANGETPRVLTALQQFNQLDDRDVIEPGQVLRFPSAWLKSQESVLQVAAVQGDVRSGGRPLLANATLSTGDTFETGKDGYVLLKLSDGSTLSVMPLSAADVKRARKENGVTDTVIIIHEGRAEASVSKAESGQTRFEIETPVANMAVRGTQFRVAADAKAGNGRVEVLEGEVAVSDSQARGEVAVAKGYGTRVNVGEAPAAPRLLLPPPSIWEGVRLVQELPLDLPFNPLRGAVAYRVYVSPHPDFSLIVKEQVFSEPYLQLGDLTDGEYFIRVHGIDAVGLEGFDTTSALQLKVIKRTKPPALAEPALDARMRAQSVEFAWSPVAEAASYTLQLARDPSFQELAGEWPDLTLPRYRAAALETGSYYWRVASKANDGKLGPFGESRSLALMTPPAPPRPAKVRDELILVSWPAEAGQTFEVQLAEDAAFQQIISEQRTDKTNVTLPRPAAGVYYFRVRATDADGFVGPHTEAMSIKVPKLAEKPKCLIESSAGVCAAYAPSASS